MVSDTSIRVVDVFAGPGGLSEGFASFEYQGSNPFDVALAIEKDPFSYRTLLLRNFLRELNSIGCAKSYYEMLLPTNLAQSIFASQEASFIRAQERVWQVELGKVPQQQVRERIDSAISGNQAWVLLGGPPCQAYSVVGRSRNKGITGYDPSADIRNKLYIEFLQILCDHGPPVFVFENVKGLISATVGSQRVFERIIADLNNPADAILRERATQRPHARFGYTIFSLVKSIGSGYDMRDFIIRSEDYGIPQTRHRVILLGVRNDLARQHPGQLKVKPRVTVGEVISDLPRIRSCISNNGDSDKTWLTSISESLSSPWFAALKSYDSEVAELIEGVVGNLTIPEHQKGDEFIEGIFRPACYTDWYCDQRLMGINNHTGRAHMKSDLHRYLFAGSYAAVHGEPPVLRDFPVELLPNHSNVEKACNANRFFSDRFRVQVNDRPSRTITSHMAKDGHYYIHPDPTQCRSLTVREAARLQTFPDNYYFAGPRTSQYMQVGNAVPPFLAQQIAEVVREFFSDVGLRDA